VNNGSWNRLYGGDGFWTQPDEDGKTAYAEYQGGNMGRIDMTNMKAEDIQPKQTKTEEKLRWNWNTPIALGSKNPKNLYVGAQYLYKSTNQGRSWKRISNDLTTDNKEKQKQEDSGGLSADNTSAENHCTIFTVAESPLDENMIWVGTDDGNLQYSNNGGTSWNNVTANIAKSGIAAGAWVSSIEPSHFDKNTVYATFENHMYGDHATYLGKSTDLGKTWTRIQSKEFTGFAHKICEDVVNKKLLFLGTEMGLFATLDGGDNWFRMKNNIPDYALVRDIKINPRTNDLIIATHGRGIMILDDIRAMRNLTSDIWDKDVYVFPMPDMVLNNGRFGWGGTEISGGWGTGNPSSIPTIDYYLKERLSTGKVEIEILDAAGKLLQTIPGTKRKGINKVFWNMRGTPPKVAAGSTKMDGAGFTAPMVLPGKYTIRIKVKDQVFTNTVNCVHDTKNADLSEANRKLVYDKSMELQQLYTKLSNSVDTISKYQARTKKDTTDITNKAFNADLEKIRAELMATKQTSIFADEERIREKLSQLYSNFCGMETAPNDTQLKAIEAITEEYNAQAEKLKKVMEKYKSKLDPSL